MNKDGILSTLWILIITVCLVLGQNQTFLHTGVTGRPHLLEECCGDTVVKRNYWKFNGASIFVNKLNVNDSLSEGITITDDFSLYIRTALLSHEGVYTCLCGRTSVEYDLKIEVPPILHLTINGSLRSVWFEKYDIIMITCQATDAKPAVKLSWMIDGFPVNSSDDTIPTGNVTFSTTSTLRLKLEMEINNITCFAGYNESDQRWKKNVTVYTYELPELSLSFSYDKMIHCTRMYEFVYVMKNDSITATCAATKTKQNTHITWLIGNTNGEESIHANTSTSVENSTITTSDFWFQVEEDISYITCVAFIQGINVTVGSRRGFIIYGPPEVTLTINGKESGNVTVYKNNVSVALCRVVQSEVDVSLTWLITDVINVINITNSTTKISLKFLPEAPRGIITCVVTGPHCRHILTQDVSFYRDTSEEEETGSSTSIVTLSLSVIVVVILLAFAAYCIKVKLASRRRSAQPSDITLTSRTDTIPKDVMKRFSSDSSNVTVTSNVSEEHAKLNEKEKLFTLEPIPETDKTEDQRVPPKLELPKVPSEASMKDYSTIPGKENVYYSTVKERATQERMFYEEDMCMIYTMKMGRLYNRWMGTISVSDDVKKCVVISTIADAVLKTKEIHWDEFVKRMLDLPNTENLTNVEGICIDTGNLIQRNITHINEPFYV